MVMVVDLNKMLELFKSKLSGGRTKKFCRFMLNVFSSTPVIGGVFSAIAAAWSESEQAVINQLYGQSLQCTDDKVEEGRNTLNSIANRVHVVAGKITFNPNTAEIISSSDVVSLTDNGTLDFTINFSQWSVNYVFNYYGNGPIVLKGVEPIKEGVRVVFQDPAPSLVTFVFFDQQPNITLDTDAKKCVDDLLRYLSSNKVI